MPDQSFYNHLARYLRHQSTYVGEQIARAAQEASVDAVHDLRVALRQTRSVMDTLGMVQPELMRDMRHLSRLLGKARDYDVLIEDLLDQPGLATYRAHLMTARETETHALLAGLVRKRAQRVPRLLEDLADHLPTNVVSLREAAEERLGTQLKRTKKYGRQIGPGSRMNELHELRIECKKLRYLAEMFGHDHVYPLKELRRPLHPLLRVLGDLNDNAVKIESITRYAATRDLHDHGRAELIDLGRYVGHCETSSVALRRSFPALWEEFDSACTRKKLKLWLRA